MHVGQRDHRAHRAGAADHDVGVGEHRRAGGRTGTRRRRRPSSRILSARRLARGSDRFTMWTRRRRPAPDAWPRQRAHRAGADRRRRCGRPARPACASAMSERDRHHRGARGVDAGLGVHPLADRQRALGQLVQGAPDGVVGLGGGVGAAHLAEHLLFADHRRVQAAGDREQVLDGGLGVADVGVLGEVAQRHAGVFGEHLTDHRQAAVEGLDHRVDLDAVAGGQHHGLGHQRGLQHLVDDLGLIGLVGAQLLEHGHRRAAVRNPEKQNAHGLITTLIHGNRYVGSGHQILLTAVDRFADAIRRPDRRAAGLVELPVAVLAAVEQHHRQPVAELGPQRRDRPPRPRRRRRWW